MKVLHAIHPFTEATVRADVVRGQYGPGASNGVPLVGYRSEPKVQPGSPTETYIALRLVIDNWRFAGVPFYLRTGKRLPARVSEIAIQFNRPPLQLFEQAGVGGLERLLPVGCAYTGVDLPDFDMNRGRWPGGSFDVAGWILQRSNAAASGEKHS